MEFSTSLRKVGIYCVCKDFCLQSVWIITNTLDECLLTLFLLRNEFFVCFICDIVLGIICIDIRIRYAEKITEPPPTKSIYIYINSIITIPANNQYSQSTMNL